MTNLEGRRARVISTGAVLWVACAQFFVCEQIASLAWKLPYSFATNYISDLGATACSTAICSPWHAVINSSFVLQGLLIAGGAILTWKQWTPTGRIGLALLQACGVGLMVVGFVPEDANPKLHLLGAAIHFLGAGFGMVVVGFALRRGFGWISMAMGLLVLASTVDLAWGGGALGEKIGAGALERIAAYGITGWMVILGFWSCRRLKSPAT